MSEQYLTWDTEPVKKAPEIKDISTIKRTCENCIHCRQAGATTFGDRPKYACTILAEEEGNAWGFNLGSDLEKHCTAWEPKIDSAYKKNLEEYIEKIESRFETKLNIDKIINYLSEINTLEDLLNFPLLYDFYDKWYEDEDIDYDAKAVYIIKTKELIDIDLDY